MSPHRSCATLLRIAVLAIGLLVIGSAELAAAATTYVNNHYGNEYPGTGARRNPYHTIQMGIDASAVGDTIMVARGTYHERITLKSEVALKGAGADVTTIDGDAGGSVVTAIDVDANTSITGFTITNGTGTWDEYEEWVDGGGMYCKNSELTVSKCVLYKNIAYTDPDYDQGQGGGIFCADSSLTITDNRASGEENMESTGGGIMSFSTDVAPRITNCIIWRNRPNQIRSYASSLRAIVRYSNVQLKSGTYRGPGNINRRPRFVDFNGADNVLGTADDDLHLRSGSPGIDAGDNHALGVTAVDLDGNPRRVDDPQTPDTGRGKRPDIDMGAYEFQGR
jgi:hypothetical protein